MHLVGLYTHCKMMHGAYSVKNNQQVYVAVLKGWPRAVPLRTCVLCDVHVFYAPTESVVQ